MYKCILTGGPRDGEVLRAFDYETEAIRFAESYWREHEDDLDPVCGGVMIIGPDGKAIEW